MARPSIVVIGAGVAGLSSALRAAELGCEVTVLERSHIASGSSGRSAGVYNTTGTDPLTIEIRVRARERLETYERENALPLDRIGYVRLARTERHLDMFREAIALQEQFGAEPSRLVDRDGLLEIVPHLRVDDLVGGLYSPRDGTLDGPLLCGVLAERAQAAGATIEYRQPVTGHGTGKKRRHVVRTEQGEFEGDMVINAAGPWAMQVGELLEAPLPLMNQVHDVIKVRIPPEVDYTVPLIQGYIPGEEEAPYIRQDGPSRGIAGLHTYSALDKLGTECEDPDDYRVTIAWESWEEVARRVSDRFPVEGLGFAPGWTGLYPISADGHFVVGPYDHDPTIVAIGGLGGAGVTSGVSLGPAAAEWAVLGEPETVTRATELKPGEDRAPVSMPTA
jgi:glycine/D-amino acid oxidase-like deaminating enzyme